MVDVVQDNALVVFQDKKIRRTWHNEEWYFSVVDVIEILTESTNPKQYIKKMRQRDTVLDSNWGTICTPLEIIAQDGKKRETNCINTEGAFRIIQSIPSPKAEPFKLWLAKVGYERVQEIQDPELAQKRIRETYKLKGYSDEWIEKRVRGIAVRDELTNEWENRGVEKGKEFAILTAEISKATFGMTPNEYKELKKLDKPTQNLMDHMNDLELIFTMLGEKVTTEITRAKEASDFDECKDAAIDGGEVAGNARKDAEKKIGKSIISEENFLKEPEKEKRKKLSESITESLLK